ncbi:MAG: type II secretion system GspH family protein [Campylobacteraceae bacterium]|jgi:prepilin-type N-terminal cleavage/methylation domain-containing protein|nr:type II secretion system GspH family protein [Campylobacteraceae bacterium]
MKKNAFTMVEVIMVIVIFGIIATIGANIIAKMYMNYMQSRTINYLQTQSAITLEQISKRLQYRIKDSIVARNTNTNDVLYLGNSKVDESFNVIEWIGYSNEAMLIKATPGWSGFIDIYSTNTNRADKALATPGSNLVDAANIMKVLSNDKVDLSTNKEAALIFKGKYSISNQNSDYGWDGNGGNANYMLKVIKKNDQTFLVNNLPADTISIYEQYYLAHSAYAIVPVGDDPTNFNLELRYNYQPWLKTKYDDVTTARALLATHVNLFRIKQVGNTIRLKLCLHDNKLSGFGDYIVACKEEVVL